MNRPFRYCLNIFVLLFVLSFVFTSLSSAQITENEGYASWYNRGSHGRTTSSGESYDHAAMTAAHPSLPFDSMVRVTRLDNGRSVVVRINDRMESGPGHIIDLSGAAAAKLALMDINVARVRLDVEESIDLLKVREALAAKVYPTTEVVEVVQPQTIQVIAKDPSVYTLQLGVFSSKPAATSFASSFENGWVSEISESGEQLFRVYYDRFSREQPARKAQQELKTGGHDSFLRDIGP